MKSSLPFKVCHDSKAEIYTYLAHFVLFRNAWGRGGVVVSALDFRSEGRWFDAQSLRSCCLLRQETLPHIVSLHPGV